MLFKITNEKNKNDQTMEIEILTILQSIQLAPSHYSEPPSIMVLLYLCTSYSLKKKTKTCVVSGVCTPRS